MDFNRVLNLDEDGHRRFGFYVKVGAPWNCMVYEAFRTRRGTQYTGEEAFWVESRHIFAGYLTETRKPEDYAGMPGRPRCAVFGPLRACCAAFKTQSGVEVGDQGVADVRVKRTVAMAPATTVISPPNSLILNGSIDMTVFFHSGTYA